MKKADIGLVGLAVMGENLVMNMESKGFTVAVYNRTTEKVKNFVEGRAAGKNIIGTYSIEELVENLEKPRKIMMMVKAGAAVDQLIDQLIPHLEAGDILIDGGNSHFPDTIRRTQYVESKGLLYIGTGVSGGEEGALKGPSMMPGGSPAAWPYVKPIFQAICAKVEDGSPCCDWVLRVGGGERRGPLCEDGPQRYRVRRHAAHLRGLPADAGRSGHERRGDAPGLCRLEQDRAGQLPH